MSPTVSCPLLPCVPYCLLSLTASCPSLPPAPHCLLSLTASCPLLPPAPYCLLSLTAPYCPSLPLTACPLPLTASCPSLSPAPHYLLSFNTAYFPSLPHVSPCLLSLPAPCSLLPLVLYITHINCFMPLTSSYFYYPLSLTDSCFTTLCIYCSLVLLHSLLQYLTVFSLPHAFCILMPLVPYWLLSLSFTASCPSLPFVCFYFPFSWPLSKRVL